MEDYDPMDEFEEMYAEELEAMQDLDDDNFNNDRSPKKSKKSLSFGASLPRQALSPTKLPDDPMETDNALLALGSPPSPSLETVQQALNASDLRKRKANHLFGDIDDLGSDDDDQELTTLDLDAYETKKVEDKVIEPDQLLIERIRMARYKNANSGNINNNKISRLALQEDQDYQTGDYITERIPSYPFVPMRNFDYHRYYIRLRSDEYMDQEASKVSAKNAIELPTSYEGSWKEADVIGKKSRGYSEIMKKCLALLDGEETDTSSVYAARKENEKLWVEKYQPKCYRDLLSDEGTNKTLLKWLKLWDHVVFGTKRKPPKPVQHTTTTTFSRKSPWNKDKFPSKKPQSMLSEELDAHGRPTQKIALLCGPPGLGKTTLAHIIAKHAGYNAVEVNASDDCSGDAFRLQLEAATQMKSVLQDDPRPNCLILDEIDGALSAAIEVLLAFISDKDISKGKKKKGGKPRILKRPIICICNDLYVPALRPLRQVALIINFPPTASARLAQRLMVVATKEKLKTDLGTMLLLCDKTSNDIRSCLSFLHFFCTKSKQIGLMDVQQASVGQKDTHKGLFAVWHDIFQISRKKSISSKEQEDGSMALSTRMSRILRTVQSYGDYERLCQGVHENYLHMKMRDSRFQSIAHGTEWFCYFDQLQTVLREHQNYVLMPYMPYCFATWHFLYAGMAWPSIKYPQNTYEMKVKQRNNEMILNAVLRGMDPTVRSGTRAAEMLVDTLPLLLHTIMPSLKNVNAQLFSVQEKVELHRVVCIFVEYGITYVQERTAIGDMIYRMEPNVPELVQFPDVTAATSATYAVKQLIAYETETEKIRRVSESTVSHAPAQESVPQVLASTPKRTPAVPSPSASAERKAKQADVLPNHLQTLSPQIRKPVVKHGLKNWLHVRKHTATVAKEKAAATANFNGLHEMSYIYKEGYSNAVRKNIKISDLM